MNENTHTEVKKLRVRKTRKEYARKRELVKQLIDLYVDEKANKIGGLAKKFRSSFQEAEDIYQKGFIKAHKNIEKFKGESTLKTWVYRIIQNAFLDHLRKPSVRLEKSITSLFSEDSTNEFFMNVKDENAIKPSEAYENKDSNSIARDDIKETLSKLSSEHRKAIELVFEKEYSYDRAAKAMRCSVGTVMSRVFYARRNFQKNYNRISKKFENKVDLKI